MHRSRSVFDLPLRRARRDWATRLRDATSSESENDDFDQCSDKLTASKGMGRSRSAGPQDSHEQGTIKRLGHRRTLIWNTHYTLVRRGSDDENVLV